MSTETLREVIAKDLKSTRERFRVQPDDGLLISAIKCFGGPYQLWHRFLMYCIVPLLAWFIRHCILPSFSFVAPVLGVSPSHADAKQFAITFQSKTQSQRNAALDLYIFLWTVLLFAAYWIAHSWSRSWSSSESARTIIISCVAIAGWRLYEIWIFLAALHSTPKYTTLAKMRAILNTLWHYFEVTIIFAVFYGAVYGALGDRFKGAQPTMFIDCLLTPLYFSFVTITTLGYGDHSPESWLGKLLVCFEVITGLFLFLVVLQRAISSTDQEKLTNPS